MKEIAEKRPYEKPVLEYCGPVSERTLGAPGYESGFIGKT
jgi:hypothetical protein